MRKAQTVCCESAVARRLPRSLVFGRDSKPAEPRAQGQLRWVPMKAVGAQKHEAGNENRGTQGDRVGECIRLSLAGFKWEAAKNNTQKNKTQNLRKLLVINQVY